MILNYFFRYFNKEKHYFFFAGGEGGKTPL